MRFDIVTLNAQYRGIERPLTVGDFLTKKTKPYYSDLLTTHFEYLDLTCNPHYALPYDESTFNQLTEYYFTFQHYGVDCEMIAYDHSPIDNLFNKQIKLIGIDVTHDLAESLLEDPNNINDTIKKQLNSDGLCRELCGVDAVLNNCGCGNNIWKPCWVYKVII